MKRTEETLRSMIREELQQIKKTMRDELAQKIMEEVCKKALIEARVTDVKVEQLQKASLNLPLCRQWQKKCDHSVRTFALDLKLSLQKGLLNRY